MKIPGMYSKRGWWYYQPSQVQGVRPKPIALGTKDQGEAVEEVFKIISGGQMAQVVESGSMSQLLEMWLKDASAEGVHRPTTRRVAKNTLENLSAEWGNPKVKTITKQQIVDWRTDLLKRPGLRSETMSEASVNSYLFRLKGFLSWCVKNNHLRKNPFDEIRLPRVKKTRRQAFCTLEQREMLLKHPPSEEVEFIMMFGFFAGLRFGEMLAMKAEWISGQPGALVLAVPETDYWKPKDGECRTIPVHARLEAFLLRYGYRRPWMLAPFRKEWSPAPGYRFNPKKQFKNYVTRMKWPWISYHTLRHSFATHLAQQGAPMVEIAQLLGDGVDVVEKNYIGFAPGNASTLRRL